MEISWAFMTFREQSGKPGSGIHALEATRRDVGNENQTILRTKHMWQTIMSGFFFVPGWVALMNEYCTITIQVSYSPLPQTL